MKSHIMLSTSGMCLHLIAALVSIALAMAIGLDVFVSSAGFTHTGKLALCTIVANAIGAIIFQAYRPLFVMRLLLLIYHLFGLAAAVTWLAADFVVVWALALTLAVLLAASKNRVGG